MKITKLIFLILIANINLKGQINLVPNSSFEAHDTCPWVGGMLTHAIPWYPPTTGTPDYFNNCSTSSTFAVPSNGLGYQNARTGVSYSGIVCYKIQIGLPPPYREYLQVELADTLIGQKNYCVNFYVNLYNNFSTLPLSNKIAITEMGMYLSNNAISLTNYYNLSCIPQIKSPVGFFLTDTANWMQVTGNYIAHGGEKYITIGNFKDDSTTDTLVVINNGSSDYMAYYYVDDVDVHCCTCDSTTSIHVGAGEIKKEEELTLMPNPSNGVFSINTTKKMQSIKIRDVLGREVLYLQPNETTAIIDISPQPTGVYFAEVQTEKGVLRRKLIIQ